MDMLTHYGTLATAMAAIIGLLILVCRLVWGVSKRVSKLADAYEDFIGTPGDINAGVQPVPGVMQRLSSIDQGQLHIIGQLDKHAEQIANIDKELHPNGGGSLRDQLNRVEWKVNDVERVVKTPPESQP